MKSNFWIGNLIAIVCIAIGLAVWVILPWWGVLAVAAAVGHRGAAL